MGGCQERLKRPNGELYDMPYRTLCKNEECCLVSAECAEHDESIVRLCGNGKNYVKGQGKVKNKRSIPNLHDPVTGAQNPTWAKTQKAKDLAEDFASDWDKEQPKSAGRQMIDWFSLDNSNDNAIKYSNEFWEALKNESKVTRPTNNRRWIISRQLNLKQQTINLISDRQKKYMKDDFCVGRAFRDHCLEKFTVEDDKGNKKLDVATIIYHAQCSDLANDFVYVHHQKSGWKPEEESPYAIFRIVFQQLRRECENYLKSWNKWNERKTYSQPQPPKPSHPDRKGRWEEKFTLELKCADRKLLWSRYGLPRYLQIHRQWGKRHFVDMLSDTAAGVCKLSRKGTKGGEEKWSVSINFVQTSSSQLNMKRNLIFAVNACIPINKSEKKLGNLAVADPNCRDNEFTGVSQDGKVGFKTTKLQEDIRNHFLKVDKLRSIMDMCESWLKEEDENLATESELKRVKKTKHPMPKNQQKKHPEYFDILTYQEELKETEEEIEKVTKELEEKEENDNNDDDGADFANPYCLGNAQTARQQNIVEEDDDDEEYEPATPELLEELQAHVKWLQETIASLEETLAAMYKALVGQNKEEVTTKLKETRAKYEKELHTMQNRMCAWVQYVPAELARKFYIVGVPSFKSHLLVRKERNGKKRPLAKSTARVLAYIPFGKFRRSLRFQCSKHKDTFFVVTNESYTTRIHGKCLHLNNKYTTSTRKCASCHEHINRDENSANTQYIKVVSTMNNLKELEAYTQA